MNENTEVKASSAPKTEIVYEPACRPFDNKLDVIYRFRVKPRTETENGTGQEIIIPGFDATELVATPEGQKFEAWCQEQYDCNVQTYLGRAQKNIGTLAAYAKDKDIAYNQKLADDAKIGAPRASAAASIKAELAAAKEELSGFEALAAERGFATVADMLEAMKAAKKLKA